MDTICVYMLFACIYVYNILYSVDFMVHIKHKELQYLYKSNSYICMYIVYSMYIYMSPHYLQGILSCVNASREARTRRKHVHSVIEDSSNSSLSIHTGATHACTNMFV